MISRRRLGTTDLSVSPIALGCWPIAGMTSPDVNDADSLATIEASFDAGINFLDTAYGYGRHGESEVLICRALARSAAPRDELVIATKGGIHWDQQGQRVLDGRPERLRRELETSLQRLGTDRVDLLFLHAPDPEVPVAESAGGLRELLEAGKVRAVGVSNLSLEQLQAFHAVCPISAFQPPYNMLQRQIESDTLPWCQEHSVSVVVYWPLMKGLLAGKMPRDHVFPEGDSRLKYPMFHGDQWQRNHDFVDELRTIAQPLGKSVAELVVNWTIHQPGITAALCGAKRPEQIRETAAAMHWQIDEDTCRKIELAIQRRGDVQIRAAV